MVGKPFVFTFNTALATHLYYVWRRPGEYLLESEYYTNVDYEWVPVVDKLGSDEHADEDAANYWAIKMGGSFLCRGCGEELDLLRAGVVSRLSLDIPPSDNGWCFLCHEYVGMGKFICGDCRLFNLAMENAPDSAYSARR